MRAEDAMSLIEDIITCVNVYASRKKVAEIGSYRPNDIYIHAYKELIQYIKHLFVFYDGQIQDMPESAQEWPWLQFIKQVNE